MRITITAEVTGDAGPDYGHQEVTPDFVRDYLIGGGASALVPGLSVTSAEVSD